MARVWCMCLWQNACGPGRIAHREVCGIRHAINGHPEQEKQHIAHQEGARMRVVDATRTTKMRRDVGECNGRATPSILHGTANGAAGATAARTRIAETFVASAAPSAC
eukprot:scaffold154936_cov30-Tisochrysis_lutea.AAC.4